MKNFKLIVTMLMIAVIFAFSSCTKQFDDYSQNPNQPVTVPPYLILRAIENGLPVFPNSDEERWSQFTCRNYTYYGDNRYWTGSASLNYGMLNNVVAMEDEARKIIGSDENVYAAIGKFLRAYLFVEMSLKVGDVPMSEALQKLGNPLPKYDSQKEVFRQSLQLLEDANTLFTTLINRSDVSLQGDIFFVERAEGKKTPLDALKSWQRVVNAYRLRVLINLSKKDSDGDLNVKQQFSDIIGNSSKYPLMESASDNLEFVYNAVNNKYPDNKESFGFDATRFNLSATWLNTLANLNDLRAMRVAEPARGLGFEDTDFRSFVGALSGIDISNMAAGVQEGKYSLYNRKRYYDGFTAENTALASYSEMCLNIAEGINRGWGSGDAEEWYKRGIFSNFEFYGIADGENTVTFQRDGATTLGDYVNHTVQFSYDDYYAQSEVMYDGNTQKGLSQILTQKYLAFARNSGLAAYYQWRRTGIPEFHAGSGTGNSGLIPLRFQYPSSELSTNEVNYKAAVQSQFGGDDNINAKMWIIE